MTMIARFFSTFLYRIFEVVEWFGKLVVAAFEALWDLTKDGVSWVLEQFLQLATAAVQAVDLGGIDSALGVWGSIPGNVLEVCAALGLGTCFAIITAAIGVRMMLQLIPFTRLGS
jgi:hypothetical protein